MQFYQVGFAACIDLLVDVFQLSPDLVANPIARRNGEPEGRRGVFVRLEDEFGGIEEGAINVEEDCAGASETSCHRPMLAQECDSDIEGGPMGRPKYRSQNQVSEFAAPNFGTATKVQSPDSNGGVVRACHQASRSDTLQCGAVL